MSKVTLAMREDGKVRLSINAHGSHRIRVLQPNTMPYREGSQRARAWQVVSLMNGLTVADVHVILRLLEPNIQGKVGRPLGWVVDAIDRGPVEVHR